MDDDRELVAREAARLLYEGDYAEYLHAKEAAAARLGVTRLPANREVREELLRLATAREGPARLERLEAMRRVALAFMKRLAPFEPRLVGSVATGYAHRGSDIDLHLYTDDLPAVLQALAGEDVEMRVVPNPDEEAELVEFTHFRLVEPSGHRLELTLLPSHHLDRSLRCGLTGRPMVRLSAAEVRELLGNF